MQSYLPIVHPGLVSTELFTIYDTLYPLCNFNHDNHTVDIKC